MLRGFLLFCPRLITCLIKLYHQIQPVETSGRLRHFLQEAHARQLISDKEMQYLLNLSAIWPVFYILPKVPKSLVNPLEQPIVAGNNRLTEPLSNFVDFVLKLGHNPSE